MKRLTAKFVAEIAIPGKYHDGQGTGLFLAVTSATSKSYVQRLTVQGKRRDVGLGSVRWMTLTEARAAALANWKTARKGGNPLTGSAGGAPTFREAFEAVIAANRPGWRDGRSEAQWRASIETHAAPLLDRRVDQINASDVLAVVQPHWHSRAETARRVLTRIGAVMKWSIAQGHRADNPAGEAVLAALPKRNGKRAHHAALPHGEVAAALAKVRAAKAWPGARLAVEFLVLTACRSGEVRGATWDEIDMDAATWTIPGSRMKAGREHRVPLSDRALAVLAEARAIADGSDFVFPSSRGGQMKASTLSDTLRALGVGAVPHGMRSSFRDWCAECSDAPREIAEMALAHVEGTTTERAYRRTDLFEKRRGLMQAWADYLAG